ncbi:hypothetical protein GEMRC1_014077 [Eukaryota sp. GEM-RC1]
MLNQLLFLTLCVYALAIPKYATVLQRGSSPSQLVVVTGTIKTPQSVCHGLFDDDVLTDGFGRLRISCMEFYKPETQFYATGLLEGFLMQHQIVLGFNNTGKDIPISGPKFTKLISFLDEHESWVKTTTEVDKHLQATILNLHRQVDGLAEGFLAQCTNLRSTNGNTDGCWLSRDHIRLFKRLG